MPQREAVRFLMIVHGLQGHPYKTWASTKTSKVTPSTHQSCLELSQDTKRSHTGTLRRISARISRKATGQIASIEPSHIAPSAREASSDSARVFWPRDLAPRDCPESRILVYGYDTKVSGYMVTPPNKNHVLSHGKDLLYALCRERPHDRPLVFVAHSLGGIVVKEALAASSASEQVYLKNVVESTAAVLFMGTPHRGSPDLSALGEWARSILSIFRMETSSAVLDTLRLKTSDLQRAQESFSGLWSKYDFRVKTFQESLGLTGIHLGVLGNKVVPDYSSLLGDQRERAESIQANHMDMCRFTGADDPNYQKVAGELRSIYQSIRELNECNIHQNGRIQHRSLFSRIRPPSKEDRKCSNRVSHDAMETFHQKLKFPSMRKRYRSIQRPAEETCSWLFEHEQYQDWLEGRNTDSHEGLLLLRGKPGAGKSVLTKEAHRRASLDQAGSANIIATHFFHGQGQNLERDREGMFRSLLYQLSPLYEEEAQLIESVLDGEETLIWRDFQEFFETLFSRPQNRRTFIFIDALDEYCARYEYCALEDRCGDVRALASFWRHITREAYKSGAQLSVLVSLRHFPHIALSNCPSIWVDRCNQQSIALYVKQRTSLVDMPEQTLVSLKSLLVEESQGIFLWAVLMVEMMIQRWHEGEEISTLLADRTRLPRELDQLYADILEPTDSNLPRVTIELFQWATLAVVPLRLYEWHHILAFIRQPSLKSLHEWRTSSYFTENDDQLERLIKSLSRGLLEVRSISTTFDDGQDTMSTWAGAGSLDNSHGETRVVEFIHESVREFFLLGDGSHILDPRWADGLIGAGHLQIMETCLKYLDISELDALVEARDQHGDRSTGFSIDRGTKNNHEYKEQHHHSPRAETGSLEEHVFLESLKSLSKSARGIDIENWVASSQVQIRHGTSDESTATFGSSAVRPSIDAATQVLQDYPALLSYATHRLFSHAKLAQGDPEAIVRRLQKGSWERWSLLSEGEFTKDGLNEYVKSKNLTSWFQYLIPGENNQFFRNKSDLASQLQGHPILSPFHHADFETGSVESFGSASSHGSGNWRIV